MKTKETLNRRDGQSLLKAISKDELTQKLCARLTSGHYSEEYAREISNCFVDLFAEHHKAGAPPGTFSALRGTFAIRSDDVKLFDTIATVLPIAAGIGFFLGTGPVLGASVAIAVAIMRLIHRFAMRGVYLSQEQLLLLTILRVNVQNPSDRGMTAEEILQIVQRNAPHRELAWVEHHLGELSSIPNRERDLTELVSCVRGEWRPHA